MNIRLINRILVTYLLLLISVTSNAQISTNQGFEILGNVPSDTRNTLTTLGDTSNVVWIYPGLLSYVVDQDQFWYNNGSYWKLFESGGLNSFYISNDTLYVVSTDSTYSVFLPPVTDICYSVSITYNDGLDDITAIDEAMSVYDCIRIGSSISDTIDISRPITPPRSNMTIEINGYVRVMDGDSVSLTQDLVDGDTIVYVSSTANFSAGQWVAVSDNSLPVQGGGVQTRLVSQGLKIKSILSDTSFSTTFASTNFNFVTEPDVDRVTAANVGYVGQQNSGVVIEEVDNITITGVGIVDVNWQNSVDTEPISDPANAAWGEEVLMTSGVTTRNANNIVVRGVEVKNAGLHGLSFQNSNRIRIEGAKVTDTHDKAVLVLSGSSHITITDIEIDSSLFEDGISLYSPGDYVNIRNAKIFGTTRHAIFANDVTPNQYVGFSDIVINGYGTSGITLENGNYNISGANIISRSGSNVGISILGATNTNISNLTIDATAGVNNGINIVTGNDGDTSRYINIDNFTLRGGSTGNGIRIVSSENVKINNGTIDGWNIGHTVSSSTNVSFSDIKFLNGATFNNYNTEVQYSNVEGINDANNTTLTANANAGLHMRKDGTNLVFQSTRSFPSNYTKYLFSSSTSSWNTSNTPGTVQTNGSIRLLEFGSGIDWNTNDAFIGLTLGSVRSLPPAHFNGSPSFIGVNRNIFGVTNKWLMFGSNSDTNFKSGMLWFTSGESLPRMMLGGTYGFLGVRGSDSSVDLSTLDPKGAEPAFYVTDDFSPSIVVDGFSKQPIIFLRRNNGTGTSPTPVESGDIMGTIAAAGLQQDNNYGVSELSTTSRATIEFVAEDTLSFNAANTSIRFRTIPDGSSLLTTRMTIPSEGGVNVGSGTFTAAAGVINAQVGLRINNNAGSSGDILTSNGTGSMWSSVINPAGGQNGFQQSLDSLWANIITGTGSASQLSDLSDVVSATNTNRFALMANGTTGYVGRALVEADISDLAHTPNQTIDTLSYTQSTGTLLASLLNDAVPASSINIPNIGNSDLTTTGNRILTIGSNTFTIDNNDSNLTIGDVTGSDKSYILFDNSSGRRVTTVVNDANSYALFRAASSYGQASMLAGDAIGNVESNVTVSEQEINLETFNYLTNEGNYLEIESGIVRIVDNHEEDVANNHEVLAVRRGNAGTPVVGMSHSLVFDHGRGAFPIHLTGIKSTWTDVTTNFYEGDLIFQTTRDYVMEDKVRIANDTVALLDYGSGTNTGTVAYLLAVDSTGNIIETTAGGGGASQLSDLTDVVSATNTNRFALMANGTTGYVGRALVQADVSDLNLTSREIALGTGSGITSESGFKLRENGVLELSADNGTGNVGISSVGGAAMGNIDALSDFNVAIGFGAMAAALNNADNNVALGPGALFSLTTGDKNTGAGPYAGADLTTGSDNFFGGYFAGDNATVLGQSVNVGSYAGYLVTSSNGGIGGTKLGYYAGGGSISDYLVSVGHNSATSSSNTNYLDRAVAVGALAGSNLGVNNARSIFMGFSAGSGESTYDDLILIGSEASATQSNQIVIGHESPGYESTQLKVRNYKFNIDQTLGAGQDGYVMTYNNSSGEFEAQSSSSYAEMYINLTDPDTISFAGISDSLITETTAGELANFTHSNGRLTYTGSATIKVAVRVSASFIYDNIGTLGLLVYKNGTYQEKSRAEHNILSGEANSARIRPISTNCILTLSQNDYVEVGWETNTAGSTVLTTEDLNVIVTKL